MTHLLSVLSALIALRNDQDGSVITEYLVLVAILGAGVAGGITVFGGGMTAAVDTWTTFIGTSVSTPAAAG